MLQRNVAASRLASLLNLCSLKLWTITLVLERTAPKSEFTLIFHSDGVPTHANVDWLVGPSRLRPGRLEGKGRSSGDRD